VGDSFSVHGDTPQLFIKQKNSLHGWPVVHQHLIMLSQYGKVTVPPRSHNQVPRELSTVVSQSQGYIWSTWYQCIYTQSLSSLQKAADYWQTGGIVGWPGFEQPFCGCNASTHLWQENQDQVRNRTTTSRRINFQLWEVTSPEPLLGTYPPAWLPLK